MKIKFTVLSVVIIFTFLFSAAAFTQTATIPSGTGTLADPYQISTLNNLYWISEQAAGGNQFQSVHFKQTASINASATSAWFSGKGWLPIGFVTSSFKGIYDGNNKSIYGLYINRTDSSGYGLFGQIYNGAEIKNVILTNVSITGGYMTGSIAGTASNSIISNCSAFGNINGSYFTGGLVGYSDGAATIEKCFVDVNVNGAALVGGLVGYQVGLGNLISNCYSRGNVTGSGSDIGGLVGSAYAGSIQNSYSTCFIGASGSVRGGLVGSGGNHSATNSFWDTDASGIQVSYLGTGKSTSEMKTQSTYTGWDFTALWNIDATVNNGYPYFTQKNPTPVSAVPSGSGSQGDPYIIAGLSNLYWLSLQVSVGNEFSGKYFKQINDINAANTIYWFNGQGWLPIGFETSYSFKGIYNGDGKTISNLYVNRTSSGYTGLFSYVTPGAEIRNLRLTGVSITGTNGVGGIAGAMTNTIVSDCYVHGMISSDGLFIGGLIGYSDGSSVIENSFTDVTVYGGSITGGLVGYQVGTGNIIRNCFSRGSVSGSGSDIGGLVGAAYAGTIQNSYSTCFIGASGSAKGGLVGSGGNGQTAVNSFWDNEASGISSSPYGTGKTTAEMKTQSTFTGWDFTGIWALSPEINDGYPYLSGNNPLPVSLQSFTASVSGRDVLLRWNTSSEQNNSGFYVQRINKNEISTNSWSEAGFVKGSGNTGSPVSYSFEDRNLAKGTYNYRLKQTDYNGNFEYHYLNGDVSVGVPAKFELSQNYPNPFNPTTKIDFSLPLDSRVSLLVFDVAGREVKRLINNEFTKAGYHTALFTAAGLSSGVYFYSLRTENFTQTKKMVLIK